jgi:hypothetical protein
VNPKLQMLLLSILHMYHKSLSTMHMMEVADWDPNWVRERYVHLESQRKSIVPKHYSIYLKTCSIWGYSTPAMLSIPVHYGTSQLLYLCWHMCHLRVLATRICMCTMSIWYQVSQSLLTLAINTWWLLPFSSKEANLGCCSSKFFALQYWRNW